MRTCSFLRGRSLLSWVPYRCSVIYKWSNAKRYVGTSPESKVSGMRAYMRYGPQRSGVNARIYALWASKSYFKRGSSAYTSVLCFVYSGNI